MLALRLAARRLPEHTSRFSRKDFTQPQLMACLILRGSMGLTYRATHQLLRDAPGLRETLALSKAPHFTTIERFQNAPGMGELAEALLAELMLELGGGQRPEVREIAVDATGLHATGASAYFEHRVGRSAAFVKLSAVVICGAVLPCAMVLSWGRGNDMAQGPDAVRKAAAAVRASRLYADAGYDGERLHELCRERLGIESFIRPVPRTRDGSIRSRYRAQMTPLPAGYARRSHAESFFSALKRTTGHGLRARGRVNPLTEAAFRVLGYAVRR